MSSLFDSDDDELSLRTRRVSASEYDTDHGVADLHELPTHDREVTLNTGIVLALFFALALICAVFFGFGYSMGRKSAQGTAAGADSSTTSSPTTDTPTSTTYKPAPGSPAIQAIPGYMSQSEANQANEKAGAPTVTPITRATEKPAPVTEAAIETPRPAPVVRTPPPVAAPAVDTAPPPAPDGVGTTYVQIAAVSHQEDADVLLSALKRRGYKVIQRTEPSDKLIHVQIGPFSARKDAEATRQKLLADGYNAFLK
jgi:cell division septation protein DedD